MALVALLSRITEESSTVIDESVGAVQRALESERGGEARPLGDRDRTVLELALRTQLDTLLKRSKLRGHSIEAVGVPRLLDVAIALAHAEVSDPNTPFALLEDLFDANVVSAAEAAFALVEARAAALAQLLSADQKHAKGKLTILRTCNELLRRLSKSKNTNFRGRVLMFMAYTFPLAERSGVNLKGTVATSSVSLEPAPPAEDAAVLDGTAGSHPERGEAIDYGFYSTFWGLQQAFTNPMAHVQPEAWEPLVVQLNTVLQVFGSFSGAGEVSSALPAGADAPQPNGEAVINETLAVVNEAHAGDTAEVYFAKFLTSSKLMTLQLRDGYFRRHVLVQLLIFLQAVSTERKNSSGAAKSLNAAQRQTVEALHSQCVALLKAIPPGGAKFAAAVLTMLEREEHWTKWKAAGCAAFDKEAASLSRSEVEGSRKRRSTGGVGAGKRMQLGNASLTRLWNMGGNSLEAIGQKDYMPSLEAYLKPVHEQMDPEAGIEEEYKLKNDKAFQWKALRLMARKDVSLLSKVSAPNGSIEDAAAAVFGPKEKLKEELADMMATEPTAEPATEPAPEPLAADDATMRSEP